MQLQAGFMVTPEVRLKRPLGEGGMGSLWVADHLRERKEVAVKFVWTDLAKEDPTVLERFDREANTLQKLDSPHVVKLYERGLLGTDMPFIVMELLHGETLVERLERTGEMPFEQLAFIVSQLGTALDHIHGHQIIHRDLKAENIFLLGDEARPLVKVLDFGLAKPPGAPGEKKLTAAGAMVGTAEYMSPEQIISSADVDHRADLWAMAVLAYAMLVAELPFKGEKLGEVLMAIRTTQYTLPSALRDGVPQSIDAWFAKAFNIDYNQRFLTAAEMNEAWQRAWAHAAATPPALQKKQTALLIAIVGGAALLILILVLVLALR